MDKIAAQISRRLADWEERGLARTPWEFSSAQLPVSQIDGREMLLFSSSNYLGLSTHPQVLAAVHNAADRFGAGSGGSRLTTGTTEVHHQLEQQLAQWLGYESAVFFATGYQTNVGVITALADANTTVYSDAKNHASIIDGCRLSRARVEIFPHRDVQELERLLNQCETEYAIVVTDGLFSMDGTTAPLRELEQVVRRHKAWLIVDDAHGIGTLGCTGRGLTEQELVRPDVLIGTASKALGAEGGFACCSAEVARLLRNQSRPYVYSTSNAVPIIAAVHAAVEALKGNLHLVYQLRENVHYLVDSLTAAGFVVPTHNPDSPIIPLRIGDEGRAMQIAGELREQGIHVPAIRYPTVAKGEAILRITVMATHTREQIDALVAALRGAAS